MHDECECGGDCPPCEKCFEPECQCVCDEDDENEESETHEEQDW